MSNIAPLCRSFLRIVSFLIAVALSLTACKQTRTESQSRPNPESEGMVYDLETKGVPRFVKDDYIEINKISMISKFRSSEGHDYSDDFEKCRSMKHYFSPKTSVDWASIAVFSPVTGTVSRIFEECAGWQIQIQSSEYPSFTFILFHVKLAKPLAVGDMVIAAQNLGTHIGSQTMSDIAVAVTTPKGRKLVSWFDVSSDQLIARYQQRGVNAHGDVIISKELRDANPLTCSGEQFSGGSNLDNWVNLN